MAHANIATQPPASGYRSEPPRWLFGVVNPLMRAILRSPLHRLVSGHLLLMDVTGHRTGRHYRVPVGYVQDGDTLYSGTAGTWAKNLRGGMPVTLWLQGAKRTGRAAVIADEAGMAQAYRIMLARAPHYGQMIGVALDADGNPNLEDVRRVRAAGHVVVRTVLH